MSNSSNLFWSWRLRWVQLVLTTDWRSAFLHLASRICTTHWVTSCILCSSCAMLLFTVQVLSILMWSDYSCLSLAIWFHQLLFSFIKKSRTISSSFMVLHPRMRSYIGFVISFLLYSTTSGVTRNSMLFWVFKEFQADFAPSFSKEAPIWCMPWIWHLPSQVGGMYGCSFFIEH